MTTGADLYGTASRFVGLPYVFGAEEDNVSVDDIIRLHRPLDCSEMTQRVGEFYNVHPIFPDGSEAQRQHCIHNGTMLAPSRAIHVEGALGWVVGSAGAHHVVMFAGDGKTTMEAANPRVGCNHFSVYSGGALRFNYAGLMPGVWYPEMAPQTPTTSPNPSPLEELRKQIDHAKTTIVGFAPNEIHQGQEVVTLQILLNGKYRGLLNPPLALTGDLADGRTALVLINFKERWGLSNPTVAACALDCWNLLDS